MNIKNLKIVGFKSFGTETEVSFHRGLNAIVGPNGCGKSNISDALKWVMGEHNIRNLRGDRLEDIIFSGSRDNKPLGMAEVTMVIEQNGGGFPPQYCELAEMEITRRVFRSGESEYFINKKPCLLKDIREIFMDTGMNPRAYSIVEQGSIMDIVNAAPQDLRRMLEEAAGISKYRDRKAATLRKMESTKENLARVQDIILEVQRQVRSTHRQANEAKRFIVFQKELAKIEAALYFRQHAELNERCACEEERHQALSGEAEGVRSSATVAEAAVETGRVGLLSIEKELSEAQESYYRAAGRREVNETQITHLEERLADHRAMGEKTAAELAELAGWLEAADRESGDLEDTRAATAAELASLEPALNGHRKQDEQFEAQLSMQRRECDRLRGDLNRLSQEKRSLLETATAAEARLGGYGRILDSYVAEQKRLSSTVEGLTAERGRLRQELVEKEGLKEQAESQLRSADEEWRKLDAELARETEALESGIRRLTGMEGRLEYLQKVQRDGENLREGARRLYRMASRESAPGAPIGVLGHLLHVDETHRKAVEAALGDRLESVLVKGEDTALSLAEHLKAENAGPATVVPWDSWPPSAETASPSEGTLGPAWAFIRCETELAGLVRALLRDVHLVPDVPTALRLRNRNGRNRTFCTLAGDVIHPWGGVTVGVEGSAQTVLGVTEELERLSGEVEAVRRSLEGTRGATVDLKKRLAGRASERDAHRLGALEFERGAAGLRSSLQKMDREIAQMSERLAALEDDIRRQAGEREKDQRHLDAARLKLSEFELLEKNLTADLASAEERLSGSDALRQELKAKIAQLEISRAASMEKLRSHEEAVERLRREQSERKEKTGALTAAGLELEQKIAETLEGIERHRDELEELNGLVRRHGADMDRLQKAHRSLSADVAAKSDELKHLRGRWEGLAADLSSISVTMAELKTRMEDTASRAQAETGYDFSPERVAELGDYVTQDEELVRGRAHRLKTRMAKIGPVNMAALDEITTLKERLTFLTTQKEDLEKAMESLDEAIRKINRTSREKFAETFEAVTEKFAGSFRELFSGGEALLRLEDEADLLDAGVHIWAQPPGKKMTKLSLLSGGEKALTALALLLALFGVKPAPFCLMDEVDAPLDDANTERFIKLLYTTNIGSQIVIITHNKRTMEMADNLLGVTMESPGVSKLVSVRLSERN